MTNEWNLILMFPNLSPAVPTTYDGEDVCLCSASDSRLERLADTPANGVARQMLRNFWTAFGESYMPGCLLAATDAPKLALDAEALKAFRNACALATALQGCAASIAHPYGAGQWATKWTDAFLFGFYTPARNGHVLTLDGPVRGIDTRVPRSQPTAYVGVVRDTRLRVDGLLLDRLIIAWRKYYVRRQQRQIFRPLFRSLETAFHAALFPGDGLTTVSDIGVRLALWISAFEVLCHPGSRNVDKVEVQNQLDAAPLESRELLRRSYVVFQRRQARRVRFAAKLYDDLYRARNLFLHGNRIRVTDLVYRRSTRFISLLDAAPLLYHAALLAFLKGKVSGDPSEAFDAFKGEDFREYVKLRQGIADLQDALNGARAPLDEYGNPQIPRRQLRQTTITPAVEG